MNRILSSIALSTIVVALSGCHSDAPKPSTTTQQPTATNAPKPDACAGISDPALAEDCRFKASVEAEKKRKNVDNQTQHNPASIKQP